MGGKHDFFSPKAIANRIKSKGLQKLRWYCQMCEKQCRDENGFKCHISSESHQRQMMLFAENPNKYLSDYTRAFKTDFLKILQRHGTKRIHANLVYQEYIADKNHVHMNSTKWNSLNGFVRTMAAQGILELEETEKGPFITWIDNSPEALARQEAIAKKQRLEKSDEERTAKLLEEQIEKAQQSGGPVVEEEKTELKRDDPEQPLKMKLELKIEPKPATSSSVLKPAANGSTPSVPSPLGKPAWATGGATVKAAPLKPAWATATSVPSSKPAWATNTTKTTPPVGTTSSAPIAPAPAPAPVKKLSALEEIMLAEKRKKELRSNDPNKRHRPN